MMIQQMFKPTHEKSDTQPASTHPRVLLIPITFKSYTNEHSNEKMGNITDTRKEASATETPVTMAMLGR